MRARLHVAALGGLVMSVASASCGDEYHVVDGAVDTSLPIDVPADAGWLTVSGTVREGISGALLQGAAVTVYRLSDDSVVATVVATDGTYSLPLPADGYQVEGYVGATLSGYASSYLFLESYREPDGDLALLTPGELSTLHSTVGITQDPDRGTIWAAIHGPPGMYTLSTGGAGRVAYGMPPSMTATSTNDGNAWAFNASVGTRSVDAFPPAGWSVGFDARSVKVFASSLTTTVLTGSPLE